MLAKLSEMMGVAIDDVQLVTHCMPGLNSVLHTLSSSLLARPLLGPKHLLLTFTDKNGASEFESRV
jgi:hypothetical protein